MKPSSIRWWLPLSYGAIAFITAVSLGLVLLVALRSYYTWQERQYLEENATAIEAVVFQLLALNGTDLLQSQIEIFAYLTQTQIDVYSLDGQLLASAQSPNDVKAAATLSLQVDTGESRQELSQTVGSAADGEGITSLLVIESEGGRFTSQSSVSGDIGGLGTVNGFASPMLRLQTPNSFGLGPSSAALRSNAVYRQTVVRGGGAEATGILEMSKGPAFGQAVLASVAAGVTIAGGVAVLLATAVGWWMSRRLNHPIFTLVKATEQMAAGDLTIRAAVQSPDELGRLAQSFNMMAGRIEQTISTLRQFVADAAHELNTPLTALRTNLELAAAELPANEYLDHTQNQALRLQQLNDNLLRLSRLESGLGLAEVALVDMNRLLQTSVEIYAARAEQAGLTFSVSRPDKPLPVYGAEESLQIVLDNLVDNAVKFTPAGGRIKLAAAREGSWVIVSLADTGIGVQAPDDELIYGRFHRGQNAADYPGSGLGLAIVKTIVEGAGGQIRQSNLASGSKFVVSLPLAAAEVEPE